MKKIRTHHTSAPFYSTLKLPGDKSISHRAAILSAIAEGPSTIKGFLESEDTLATIAVLQELGIRIEHPESGCFVIHGKGGRFFAPKKALDCGNSGTTMRLLAGVLAAQPFCTELIGDGSLSKRPMGRIIEPLSQMGAFFQNREKGQLPPLRIEGRALQPIHYRLPMASAQVKSAILLAALFTPGETTVIEPTACRDHTERMLGDFQGTLSSSLGEDGAKTLRLLGPQKLQASHFQIPGDISSAAFWIVAAAARSGSKICLENVGLNPTRTGVLDILKRMGADIQITPHVTTQREPFGSIVIKGASLQGTIIHGSEIPNAIDELPILAIAGALAHGTTIIKDAKELRVKETDRIHAIVTNLRGLGATVIERDDGLEIEGGAPLKGTTLSSYGDHRIAMACAIAGLFARGETLIEECDCMATSYPDFMATLQAFA